jgi:hypothetical protein
VTHAAYSTLKLAPRAEQLATELRHVVPVYTAADEPTVRLLAVTLARIERATAALDELDEQTGDRSALGPYLIAEAPKLQRLREDLRGWINTARRLAGDLGLNPTSRAKLGLDIARTEDALERLASEGREVRARAEARLEEVTT